LVEGLSLITPVSNKLTCLFGDDELFFFKQASSIFRNSCFMFTI